MTSLQASFLNVLVAIVAGAVCNARVVAQEVVQDEEQPTITIRVKAERYVDTTHRFSVLTDQEVFGKELTTQTLLIDEETKGLAEVFVWTARAEDERIDPARQQREPVIHEINVKDGQLTPRAMIAQDGDKLYYSGKDVPVALALDTSAVKPVFGQGIRPREEREFKLVGRDRKESIYSPIYPWMFARIFVMRDTHCQLTDESGTCKLPRPRDKTKSIDIQLEHHLLGELKITKASNGVEVLGDGRIRVSPDVEELEVVVQIEDPRDR